MRKLAYSLGAIIITIGLTGCGGGDSGGSSTSSASQNPTPTDVTVERGKVYDATVVDSENNTGIQKLGENVYTFSDTPKYPVTVTGGWIDVDNDGVKTLEDTELSLTMKSYSTNVTPITTYIADVNSSVRESKLDELATKTGVSIEELKKLPSTGSSDAMFVQNAIYKQIKLNDDNVTNVDLDEVKTNFDTFSITASQSPDKTGIDLSVLIEKEVVSNLTTAGKITLVNDEDLVNNKIINDILSTMNGRNLPDELNGATVVFNPAVAKDATVEIQTYDVTITVTKGEQSDTKTFTETVSADAVLVEQQENKQIVDNILNTISNRTLPTDLQGTNVAFNPSIAKIAIETEQTYDVTITVTKGDQSNTKTFTETVEADPNEAPVANAGVDQKVYYTDSVILSASSSSDDGEIVSYEWKEDTAVLSSDMNFTKTDFSVGAHNLVLQVTDDGGKSTTDEVEIVIFNNFTDILPMDETGGMKSVSSFSNGGLSTITLGAGSQLYFKITNDMNRNYTVSKFEIISTYNGADTIRVSSTDLSLLSNGTLNKDEVINVGFTLTSSQTANYWIGKYTLTDVTTGDTFTNSFKWNGTTW
ncbi:MAG: PKD domain-containing protein [Campylobacterota bacterium]|nr:PKD domain-containing protein [Campylobacterota bacterium]